MITYALASDALGRGLSVSDPFVCASGAADGDAFYEQFAESRRNTRRASHPRSYNALCGIACSAARLTSSHRPRLDAPA